MAKNIYSERELIACKGVEKVVELTYRSTHTSSMLHSRSVDPAGIPGRFSSSLLPPLFPPGRCAAIFIPRRSAA